MITLNPHRSVREYKGQAGDEPNGMKLPWSVLDSLAATESRRLPNQYVVIGETISSDGKRRLEFGVTTEFIEATTDHRWDPTQHKLRIRCPACLIWDGKHAKGCQG